MNCGEGKVPMMERRVLEAIIYEREPPTATTRSRS
jgi:hypothetical protein